MLSLNLTVVLWIVACCTWLQGPLNKTCFKSLKKFRVVGDNQISSPSDYTSSLSLHVLYLICISACPAMLYPSLLCGFCCCTKWYVVYHTTGNMSWALNMSPPLLWSATFETRTWAAAPRHAKLYACVYVRTADQLQCAVMKFQVLRWFRPSAVKLLLMWPKHSSQQRV